MNLPVLLSSLLNAIRPWYIATAIAIYLAYKLVYILYLYPLFISPLRHAPGPPYGHWLFGMGLEAMRKGPSQAPLDWVKQYGDRRGIVRTIGPFGMERIYFLSPEALHNILVADWLDYPRPNYLRKLLGLIAGFGLLTVTGNEHKQMRKFMNPAFSISNLMGQTEMYYSPIYTLVRQLKRQIADHGTKPVLMYDWLSKVTLDIICSTAFGHQSNSLENSHDELADAYHNLLGLQNEQNMALFVLILSIPGTLSLVQSDWFFRRRYMLNYIPKLRALSTLIESMHRIKAVSSQILAERMAEAATLHPSDTLIKKDIMTLLVRARINEEKAKFGVHYDTELASYRMSDDQMMAQVLTFLGAGHETTASGLSWTLYLLAKHPQVQTRLREEVTALIRKNPNPDYRELKESLFLDGVIMESLRLLPPVPLTPRRATKSDWIDGIYVKKGTLIVIPILVVNQWTELWGADASEFKPERWRNLPPGYNPTFSFQTFIAGPHACIGRTMAIVEMKAILAVLITHFEVELAMPGQMPKPASAVTMKPADGLPLRLKVIDLASPLD